MKIDTNYNYQAETEPRDADRYSEKLQEVHRILWSKKLPNGKVFTLDKISQNRLYHKSELGEFYLSSDRAIPTFSRRKTIVQLVNKIPPKTILGFIDLTETIGGMMIWPSNRIQQKMTINGAKGFTAKISDRLDLTIECIRRYYLNEDSPLFECLSRYDDYFQLFTDFKGFTKFFYLEDYVSNDFESVRIAPPFNNFASIPVPSSVEEYLQYIEFTSELTSKRNSRIAKITFKDWS